MDIRKKIKSLPDSPGIYKFFDQDEKLIYVGKSVSLKKRVGSYFASKNLGPKTNALVAKISDVKFIKVFSEFEALLLESELIRTNKPFYNILAKDDKSPIYIKITKDDVPLIATTRKTSIAKKDFIAGPFESTRTTKDILRLLRKIFPYCHHKNPKKPCLFVHLGLCPYPYESNEAKNKYQNDINKIKKILKGKSKTVLGELKKEMNLYSKNLDFEQANKLKKQIQKIQSLTTTYHAPADFLKSPNLVDDLSAIRLKDLKDILHLEKIPKRIECYDISNIQGMFATGSMVVFENGQSAKHKYRKFKIKFKNTPDDFDMLREVISRRFKNSWPVADLMIIDGGKGQLSAVVETAQKYNKMVKIVSLAKRIEEIFVPGLTESIKLPKESPARQLVQSLRDEAHRFAVTYHRHLRSKAFLKSTKS